MNDPYIYLLAALIVIAIGAIAIRGIILDLIAEIKTWRENNEQ